MSAGNVRMNYARDNFNHEPCSLVHRQKHRVVFRDQCRFAPSKAAREYLSVPAVIGNRIMKIGFQLK